MTTQTPLDATHAVEATSVPDLIAAAQAELKAAEAAGRAVAEERRGLNDRLCAAARLREALKREVQRVEAVLADASARAADAAALTTLGIPPDGAAVESTVRELAHRLTTDPRLMVAMINELPDPRAVEVIKALAPIIAQALCRQ
jgi:hypothetical protein